MSPLEQLFRLPILLVCLFIISSQIAFGRLENSNNIKYTYTVDQSNIHEPVTIEQNIVIPEYNITLKSTPSVKSCVILTCNDDKKDDRLNPNQTWNGLYLWNQKLDRRLSPSEIAYRLSSTIKGLDPILASKIVELNLLSKAKLNKRPSSWSKFVKKIYQLNKYLNKSGIKYNLYADIVQVNGLANARSLGYYDVNLCQIDKEKTTCNADILEIRKTLIRETKKKFVINYTPSDDPTFTHLYENELDHFNFFFGADVKDFWLEKNNKHNQYEVEFNDYEKEGDIIVNIKAIKRRLVRLPNNFIYVYAGDYINGIYFEWRISTGYYNDLALTEMKNIYLSYSICRKKLFGCKDLVKKTIRLDTIKALPTEPTRNEVLIERLTLKEDVLKLNEKYKLKYEIIVKGSNRIAAPKKNKKKIKTKFKLYSDE